MYHIQQNYAFLLFWIIFVEILRELHFLVKIVLSQEGALKYSEVLFLLTFLKGANPEENLNFFKQLFLIKPVKWGKY